MFKFILAIYLLNQVFAVDQVTYLEYGKKVPANGPFDLWFNYNADGNRDCEVALKKPTENWKTYAYKKISCTVGQNQFRALTLVPTIAPVAGAGYVIEVKMLSNGVQTGYKSYDVTVTAGKQGFHIYNGKVYDANANEFIIRGINNAHADYDNFNRWWAYNALKNIAATKANTVRILWRKSGSLTSTDLDKIITEAITQKLVPMIEMHDATGSPDESKLNEMAQWLADNVWLLIKHRKYIMVNIANEWSPWGTSIVKWRDAYKAAISKIRNAGFSGSLVIDASAYAQNPEGPKTYGLELLSSDSAYNLIFSVHMYAEWSLQQPNYNIVKELQLIKDKKIPFIIGEFANKHPASSDSGCIHATIDAKSIMTECKKHAFGYIGWSWAGNGNDNNCGSINYLDVVSTASSNVNSNSNWGGANGLSTWGNEFLYSTGIGIRDTSVKATVFL